MSANVRTASVNLNTILLSVVLGILSWVGYTAQTTSVAIAVIYEKTRVHDLELLTLRKQVAAIEIRLAAIP